MNSPSHNEVRQLHEEVIRLRESLDEHRTIIAKQAAVLSKLKAIPKVNGWVLKIHRTFDPSILQFNDPVLISDANSPYNGKTGIIVSGGRSFSPIAENRIQVKIDDADDTLEWFSVAEPRQITLINKSDGSRAEVLVEGKRWLGPAPLDPQIEAGDCVWIDEESKIIGGKVEEIPLGPVCSVIEMTAAGVEVQETGQKRFVLNPRGIVLKAGDRVVIDHKFSVVLKKLPAPENIRFQLANTPKTTWDDIGGLEDAKTAIRETIELPLLHPELFHHYSIQRTAGMLLYGPPGCGKTMLVRATAHMLAMLYGKEYHPSAYLYIKSPELYNMYVGNTEDNLRQVFSVCRAHYHKYGYPATVAFDEADALFPQRGRRRSSDISDTVVPMFLGEMDGADEEQTKANPLVFLLTNRPDTLDPAVTRYERINKHIRVGRPDAETALDVIGLYAKGIPFQEPGKTFGTLAVAVEDLFSKSRTLYRVMGDQNFTLGDACNGAMLKALMEKAKMLAIHRDIRETTKSGVTLGDLRMAVDSIFKEQRGLNHQYDLEDFAESKGIPPSQLQFERITGMN
jgi:proteasome ATPase